MRLARRVLEDPEAIEERRGSRRGRVEELESVASPLGRDSRGVERGGGGREELGQALEAAGEAPAGAPPEGSVGFRARGERPSEGRGEAPSPPGDVLPEPRDLRGVDAERGELVREDRPKESFVLDPLREERAADLLGTERREAPAKVPRRGPERVAVLRFRKAPKEAGGRLEAPQRDPDVVNEGRVASSAGALLEPAQPLRLARERVFQDREDRAGSSLRQRGPPPPILGPRCEGAPQVASLERPGSSSDGWPTW